MREYQVRICERLGVKFPGPTRQSRHFERAPLTSGLPRLAEILRVTRHVAKVPNPDIALERKSRPKAALNLNLMIVDQAAINAGLDFRR